MEGGVSLFLCDGWDWGGLGAVIYLASGEADAGYADFVGFRKEFGLDGGWGGVYRGRSVDG